MGLDISAYSNIEVLGVDDKYDEELEWDDETSQEFINPHFPHAVDERFANATWLRWKGTDKTESIDFRAGSYSGYGLFRSTLAGAFLDTKDLYMDNDYRGRPNGDWDKVHESEGKPFYELINFSDCEGVFIGPVCAKLHRDFVVHRDAYISSENPYEAWEQDYFISRYDNFTEAFRLGAENGLVSFH